MRKVRALFLLGLLAAGASGGCAMVAYLAAQLAPMEKAEPVFRLPADKNVLVFVDDVPESINYEPVKMELAQRVSQRLVAAKAAKSTVPYHALQEALENSNSLLSVRDAGRNTGADLVVYVNIDRFSLRDEAVGRIWHGQMSATVRVVDVTQGLLWPKDRRDGYRLPSIDMPPAESDSSAYGRQLSNLMAARMADCIVKLFCEHRVGNQRPQQD